MPIVPEFQIGLWSGWWFSVVFMAGGACDMSQCHHCPLGGSCATDTRGNVWVLTAKGAQATEDTHRGTGSPSD